MLQNIFDTLEQVIVYILPTKHHIHIGAGYFITLHYRTSLTH